MNLLPANGYAKLQQQEKTLRLLCATVYEPRRLHVLTAG